MKKVILNNEIKTDILFPNESEFMCFYLKYIESLGFCVFRDSDFDRTSLKPCDAMVCDLEGVTSWIEFKYTRGATINTNCLEPQQRAYGHSVSDNGGSYIVIIYSKATQSYIAYGFQDFILKANNVGTVNLFGEKKKDVKKTEKKLNLFSEKEMIDNIPL